MPVAERSRPSGLRPPPPPRSELSEAASWTAWSAEICVTELPNRMRETISSCGRPGEEVKAICGLFERPVTLMPTSTLSMSLVAARSICGLGGRSPTKVDLAAVEPEAAAGEAQRAADQLDLADELGRRRRAPGRADPRPPFGFEAHAGDEDAVVGARRMSSRQMLGTPASALCSLPGVGSGSPRAADAGQLRHFGGGLPDDLVADLAEIELARDRGALGGC